MADERLLAVVDDLHRPVRVQREHRAVNLHRQVLAASEGAADAGEVDPDLVGLEPQARRHLVAVDVEPLRRDVDVDAALAVRNGEPGLRAEEGLVLDADLVHAGDGDLALRLRVAVTDDERADDVRARIVAVTVAHRRAIRMERFLFRRALRVDDRLERVVLDLDPLRGAARLLRMLGRNECDRLAEVANTVPGQHGLVAELEPVALLSRDVGVRQHGVDAGHRQRLGEVDRTDPRMGVRAPQRVAPEHSRCLQVARVGELAGHLRNAVDARNDLADASELELRCCGLAHVEVAASRTASKIFA